MTTQNSQSNDFFQQLDARIAKYDLLCHPFYKAWSAGELTREDLGEYSQNYFHHVAAFTGYLAAFACRQEDGPVRRAVLANMAEEEGHSDLWLDFAEGMGAGRTPRQPIAEVSQLIADFDRVATEAAPAEALAAFYAYESQVPRVAQEKARGLKEMYGADEKTCGYFTLHTTADVYHSNVWKNQLGKQVEANPEIAEEALNAAEAAAKSLWNALDGIEARRTQTLAA
ncbi:MAG: iron-containing redox enzyme family protein [Terriglobales bacterium]|jgi:pyrroloquinoline-quinone synthase